MNLLEIRQQFIKLTGREELATTINEDYDTDAGADFFINGGIRDLDLEQVVGQTIAEQHITMAIGEYEILMRDLRFVRRLFTKNSEGTLTELDKKDFTWLTENYPKLGSSDAGTTAYYTLLVDRQNVGGRSTEYRKLFVMPPTDTALELIVYGGFFSTTLVRNEDENWWTIVNPNLAIMAAIRNMEGFYRNTQGYNDYDAIIQKKLEGIELDQIEDEF